MKKKFEYSERRGLPGGPNETFSYTTGVFSTEGYKRYSPDVNNPFNIIPSGNITMKDVDFPVEGTDNLGNSIMMKPGYDYKFPGNMVFERPIKEEKAVKPYGSVNTFGNIAVAAGGLKSKNLDIEARYAKLLEQLGESKGSFNLGVNAKANKNNYQFNINPNITLSGDKPRIGINAGIKKTFRKGGGLLTKNMKCNNCGWSWRGVDGGKDATTCHKCGGSVLPKAQEGKENITYLPDRGGYQVPVDLETGNIKGGILPEVIVSGKATPLVRHKRAYETNNPFDAQQYATDLFNNPKSREEYFDRFNKDRFFQKYGQRGYNEFQDNAWKYAAEQRMSQLPQGNRSRIEYLNDLTAKEEELFKKYNPALQTTYSADFVRAVNAKDRESYDQLKDKLYNGPEKDLYTEREKQNMLQNYKYIGGVHGGDALAPLTWMSKPIQSIYRDDYSGYDALVGRKNDATILEDVFTDPTLIYGLGKTGLKLGAQGLKQIGKYATKSFIPNLDNVGTQAFKPVLNTKQLSGSTNAASSIDNVGSGLTNTPQPWQMQELPGLHLKSTMEGEAISKIVEPKTGLINTEQALAIIGKESGGADKVALIKQALGDNIPKKMDFNDFRKVAQDQLIPLERQFATHSSNYGIERLGYGHFGFKRLTQITEEEILRIEKAIAENPKITERDLYILKNYEDALKQAKIRLDYYRGNMQQIGDAIPLENQTLILSNKSKFGRGSSAHNNPEETLGHIHFLRNAETPDVLTVTQIQSDAFQGTHRIMPKSFNKEWELKNIEMMERMAKKQYDEASKAVPNGKDSFILPDGTKVNSDVLKQMKEGMKENIAMKKAVLDNFSQKQLLDKNHQERYLQELVDYAGKRGDVNKIRVPTSETAAKVQNYSKIELTGDNTPGFAELQEKISIAVRQGNQKEVDELMKIHDKMLDTPYKKYSNEHQTILKKYSQQPKTIKKLFGKEPTIVTDSKGNTWYEFDIPDKFKKGKGEIKAFGLAPLVGAGVVGSQYFSNPQEQVEYRNGGQLPKAQFGIPTTADSLALYYNAIEKGKHYENDPDYTEAPSAWTDNSHISYIFDEVVKNKDLYNKQSAELYNQDNKYGSPEPRFNIINPNMIQLGDILMGQPDYIYNNAAPPILLHNIIEPTKWVHYWSNALSDGADIPYYDPVTIYPKSLGEVPLEAYKYSDIPYVNVTPSSSVTPSVNYNTDLVAYLQKEGKPFDYNTRKDLAKQYGIDNYKGTAAQNIELLDLIKKGPLPVREKEELGTLPQREVNSKVILNPFEKEGTYSRSRQPQEKGSSLYDKYGKQYPLIDYYTKDGKKIGTYDPVNNEIVEKYQKGGSLPKAQFGQNISKLYDKTKDAISEDLDYAKRIANTLPQYLNPKTYSYSKEEGVDSIPNYNKYNSFGEAFKQAREDLGRGQTFLYNGKRYTTTIENEFPSDESERVFNTMTKTLSPEQKNKAKEYYFKQGAPYLSLEADDTKFSILPNAQVSFSDLSNRADRPHANPVGPYNKVYLETMDYDLTPDEISEYEEFTGKTFYRHDPSLLVEELAHIEQVRDKGTGPFFKHFLSDAVVGELQKKSPYVTEGAIEYDAHEVIGPKRLKEIMGYQKGGEYTVQAGNTFDGIANLKEVPKDLLRKANPGIDYNNIKVGQVINIPDAPKTKEERKEFVSTRKKEIPSYNPNIVKDLPKEQTGLNIEGLKEGIAQAESVGGIKMINPESTATGLYGQRFSELEDKNIFKGTREDFAKDIEAQNRVFDIRLNEGLDGKGGLIKDAEDLYLEYFPQIDNFEFSKEDLIGLINFIGRQGTRQFLGYHIRDGKPLSEALPNIYSDEAKQSNKTPFEYLEIIRDYYKTGGEYSVESGETLNRISRKDNRSELEMYKNYINGIYDGTEREAAAERIYDKLNRVYYGKAKSLGMSVPNYIMTNIINRSN